MMFISNNYKSTSARNKDVFQIFENLVKKKIILIVDTPFI